MQWLVFPVAGLVAFAILIAPGYLVTWIAGVERHIRLGLAPLISLTMLTLAGLGAYALGWHWGVFPVVVVTALAVIYAVIVRRVGDLSGSKLVGERRLLIPGAFLITAVLSGLRTLVDIHGVDSVSQSYDGVYHLNTVAMIRDTGQASPLHMNLGRAPTFDGFYPNAWHALVSLVLRVTAPIGATIPTVANATTIVIVTVVWTSGVLALATTLTRRREQVALIVLLAHAIPLFPALFVGFGVLYPNLTGYALIPGILALIVHAVTPTVVQMPPRARTRRILAAGMIVIPSLVGLTNAHPSATIVAGIASVIIGASAASQHLFHLNHPGVPLEAHDNRHAWRMTGAHLVTLVASSVIIVAGYALATRIPTTAAYLAVDPKGWQPLHPGRLHALVYTLALAAGSWFQNPVFLLTIPVGMVVIIGWVVAFTRPRWMWVAWTHLAIVILNVEVMGESDPHLRALVTGLWYTDTQRLAALLPLTSVPLLALGFITLRRTLLNPWLARRGRAPWSPRRLSAAALVVMLVCQLAPTALQVDRLTRQTYALPEVASHDKLLLSAQERRLLERLGDTVPEGDAVIGNPWDGSVYAWALGGRRTVFPQMSGYLTLVDWRIAHELGDNRYRTRACAMLADTNARWLLDFGPYYLWDEEDGARRFASYPGVDWASTHPEFTLVDHEGRARLYRIEWCDDIIPPLNDTGSTPAPTKENR